MSNIQQEASQAIESGQALDEAAEGEEPQQIVFKEAPLTATSGEDAREVLKDLLSFHLGFGRPKSIPSYTGSRLVPALMASYRDLSVLRYDYPLCLLEKGDVISLGNIFNQVAGEAGGATDNERRVQFYLKKLEFAVKSLVEQGTAKSLSDLWGQGVATILSNLDMEDPRNQLLRADLNSLKQGIELKAQVIACDRHAPLYVLYAIWKSVLAEKGQRCEESVGKMIFDLKNILDADDAKAGEAYSPERLKCKIGRSEELDVSELSKILAVHASSPRMSASRRQRIENTLKTLKELQSLYRPRGKADEGREGFWSYDGVHPISTFSGSLPLVQKYIGRYLECLKALQIARLEIEGVYREEKHDAFFAGFTSLDISHDDMALCPPLVVPLRSSELDESDKIAILEALTSPVPLKIVLLVDDLDVASWLKKTGEMAMALQDAFVLQGSSNNLPALTAQIKAGLHYSGPALFHFYTGELNDSLCPYLVAGAAHESRLFPSFTYQPDKGNTLAQRFSLAETSEYQRDWPESPFSYQTAEGKEVSLPLPFTSADFLTLDRSFTSHFMWVPRHKYHENMVILHEYLKLAPEAARDKIPYILMVDEENTVHRVVVGSRIILETLHLRDSWHRLQELGGVNNSCVLKVVEEEKARLERQKQEEMAALEQKYRQEMEQNLGQVAEAIIEKIAGGLLGLTSATTVPIAPPRPTPSAPPTPTVEALAPAAPAVEEEKVTIDEPYIETPRCTTCNECTNINKQMFAYNENKQAYIKDPAAGTFRQLVMAAEKCTAKIVHPGKPLNPKEEGLAELIERAKPFNK